MKMINKIRLGILLFLGVFGVVGVANGSLSDFWQSRGQSFIPCNQERRELAAELAVWGYDCSAEKNAVLEQRLRDREERLDSGENVGASVATGYKTTLNASMTSSQTTVPVSSLALRDGTILSMSALNNKVFLVIEPGSSREEIVVCTAITSSQFSSCTRGLAFSGTAETTVSANRKAHRAGSVVIMSDVHYVFEQLVDKDQAETIAGVKTFTSIPLIPTTTPTDDRQAVSLYQFQQATTTGGINGSETQKGVWEGATQAEMAAGTATGTSGAYLTLQSRYANATPTANAIVISNALGKLPAGWGGSASTLATLDSNSLVVQNPANASVVPGASKIPISSASTSLQDGWLGGDAVGDLFYSDGTNITDIDIGVYGQYLGVNSTNNGYTFGCVNRKIYVNEEAVTFSNTSAEQTLASFTLPGGLLSTANALKVSLLVDQFQMNVSGSHDLDFKYDNTVVATVQFVEPSGTTVFPASSGRIEAWLFADGATNAQKGKLFMQVIENGIKNGDAGGTQEPSYASQLVSGTAAEDSTGDLTVSITSDWISANSNSNITIEGIIAELVCS